MKQLLILASATIALAACENADQGAPAQSQPAETPAPAAPDASAPAQAETNASSTWITLFSGVSLDGWNKVGDANWRIVDNYVEADSGTGFLVTPGAYSDFHLRVEFWVDDPANSGVFIRCSSAEELSADTCYEVNVYDHRPDQAYRTGAIVEVAEPMAQINAADHWNTFEITAEGPRLMVRLNGTLTVDTEDTKHASGPIGLQYNAGVDGKGVVRFRHVQLIPL